MVCRDFLSIPKSRGLIGMYFWPPEGLGLRLEIVVAVRNMVINYPFYFHFYFYIYSKTFSLFLGNVICLETVLQLFTNHCFIQNCYAKLATERKLRRVSTYLPIPEALCLKHVWNTRSATTNSSPRPRPSGGQEYIPMSLFDS